jgi:uncharacterized BrkB/YihY/UPF0761 family membrane protein
MSNHHHITKGRERMKVFSTLAIFLILVFILSSCVAGPNKMEKTPDDEGKVAGFWKGLWHGLISPITFVISIFSKTIRFYEVHNNGSWYNFGFVLGAGLFLSGGIFGRGKSKKKR